MKKVLLTMLAIAAFAAFGRMAKADTIDDPLHGFCWNGTTCSDNGTNTPTTSDPPYFGFYISPGPQTGNYLIDILVPTSAGIQPSFSITGTLSGTASLFSTTPWSTGFLDSYLGLDASPANPCGAYQLSGSNNNSTGCGISYYVYQADLGKTVTLQSSATGSPDLTITGGVPTDTYIVGFLVNASDDCKTDHKTGVTTCGTVATANSGAILEDGPPPTTVPEPGSLTLLGTGLLTLGGMLRRRLKA